MAPNLANVRVKWRFPISLYSMEETQLDKPKRKMEQTNRVGGSMMTNIQELVVLQQRPAATSMRFELVQFTLVPPRWFVNQFGCLETRIIIVSWSLELVSLTTKDKMFLGSTGTTSVHCQVSSYPLSHLLKNKDQLDFHISLILSHTCIIPFLFALIKFSGCIMGNAIMIYYNFVKMNFLDIRKWYT